MPGNLLIEKLRPAKNVFDENIPYHFLHEQEPGLDGELQTVNTLFLTGKECAFKCLMCDLWKNTLDFPTPPGAIVKQIDYALSQLPKADAIKLYNASNFFDPKAVPFSDHAAIAARLQGFSRVIVENHPKLCEQRVVDFAKRLSGRLEVAMGLETIYPESSQQLNKHMTPDDFKRAATFLRNHDMDIRTFVLLNPPYLTDQRENIEWAVKSVQFAFECGADRCTIIPTRSGNGVMELLQAQGHYRPPTLSALEEVFDRCLQHNKGQVFVDTWDIGFLSDCPKCFEARTQRLDRMNLHQQIELPVLCTCH
ncbi:radical SAM protein [Dyadobacter luticola]|uniref:Radical SAM protein n=1 Tax=Dyadobacter luticola TaxID=1979387 RepID=A0A5R9L2Q9_9BACT|nr:radical SAM protein [Dyadobacter luticola]TLV02846.1 radical SAM protein [Dyadobacter luticola]